METQRRPGWAKLALAALALCLAPAWLAGQEPKPAEPAQKLEQLKHDFHDQQTRLHEQFMQTEDQQERRKLYDAFTEQTKKVLQDARAIAESAGDTETAAQAWSFVMQTAPNAGDEELVRTAFDKLIDKHLASPVWKEIAPMLGELADLGVEEAKLEQSMRLLMEKSPLKEVQAGAMYSLGVMLGGKSDPAKHAEGLALVKRVQKDFADVKEAKEYVKQAEATLFELEKLQPGMPCPDFETTDETGAKFKLSDYKGKVVLVDFWGYW